MQSRGLKTGSYPKDEDETEGGQTEGVRLAKEVGEGCRTIRREGNMHQLDGAAGEGELEDSGQWSRSALDFERPTAGKEN